MSPVLESRLDTPAEVAHLSCIVCLQQGFRCSAYRLESEGPLCIYHVDGETCPHRNAPRIAIPAAEPIKPMRKPKPAVVEYHTTNAPAELPAHSGDTLKIKPIEPKEKPEMNPVQGAEKCNAPGCEVLTRSKTGYCGKHFFLSRAKNKGEPGKCDVCGDTLRRDNETGLCKKHRKSAHAVRRIVNISAAAGDVFDAAARINLSLSERQLVQLFAQLPLESKAALLNRHFQLETL